MSEFLSKAREQILIYWLAVFYALLFSGVSWGVAWMTATAGVDYSTLGHDAKVRVWVCCFTGWGTTMMAFLNKAISSIQKGLLPINSDDSKLIASRTETSTLKTEIKTP